MIDKRKSLKDRREAALSRATTLWQELEALPEEEFRALLRDPEDERWDKKTSALLASEVCFRVGLVPYGPDFPSYKGPSNWQRFFDVPVVRVQAFIRKHDSMDSEAGQRSYLERWSSKYSPAFAEKGD